MNETQGFVFIKAAEKHETVIVWERAEIDDMMDDMNYVFIGTCIYDTEKKYIKHML